MMGLGWEMKNLKILFSMFMRKKTVLGIEGPGSGLLSLKKLQPNMVEG